MSQSLVDGSFDFNEFQADETFLNLGQSFDLTRAALYYDFLFLSQKSFIPFDRALSTTRHTKSVRSAYAEQYAQQRCLTLMINVDMQCPRGFAQQIANFLTAC